MLDLIAHVFAFAETYAVLLVWITVPLGVYAAFLFMRNHYGMFEAQEHNEVHHADH